jgi:DNA-binding beta-propeller fold protein YncE
VRRTWCALAPILASLFFSAPAGAGNLFVLDQLASEVKEFDATSGDFIGVFGETDTETISVRAMAFHPVTRNLFILDANGIQEFDGQTGAFVGIFANRDNLTFPLDMEFEPTTHQLWVVENFNQVGQMFFTGDVRAFDGTTGAFLGSIGDTQDALRNPIDLDFHPLQDRFMVGGLHDVMGGSDVGVWEFDRSVGDFIGAYGDTDDFNAIGPLAFDPVTGDLVARENNSSNLRVFNETGQFTQIFDGSMLMLPEKLAFHPVTGELLVADSLAGAVMSLDGEMGSFNGVYGQTDFALKPIDLAFQPMPEPSSTLLATSVVIVLAGLRAAARRRERRVPVYPV